MYVETSSPARPGQLGIMSSKSFSPTNNRTLTFKYSMKGGAIIYLQVNKVDDVGGNKTQLFRKDGHQANIWLPASVNFASTVSYTVSFPSISSLKACLFVACVQTLDKKLKGRRRVESAQLSHYSCSRVLPNQGT